MTAVALLFVLALGIGAGPFAVEAQPVAKVYRVGFLSDAAQMGPLRPEYLEVFREGLRTQGWLEGRNVVVDFREIRTFDQRPEIVAALLRGKPDVIVTTPPAVWVIHPSPSQRVPGWTPIRDIPIVFTNFSDPVGAGLVQSLARPGGNVTGLSYLGVELNPKRLELLKELLPTLTRVAVLVPSNHRLRDRMITEVEAAARSLGVHVQRLEVSSTDPVEKIDAAFEAAIVGRAEAVLGLQGPHYYRERKRVCDLAARSHLPGAFEAADYVDAGCLMSYATSYTDLVRRAAGYVDRILRGAKPADMPVQQPTKFDVVINMRTAKALGLTIPPSLLLRADQVID